MNQSAENSLHYNFPSYFSRVVFKYLGVNIARTIRKLHDNNFTVLITKVKVFQRWNSLPLTLAGRIQCIKMNIVPKYLFLCQCLPLFLSKSFFRKIDSVISTYVWDKITYWAFHPGTHWYQLNHVSHFNSLQALVCLGKLHKQ